MAGSDLSIKTLKGRTTSTARLMNVKVPAHIAAAIDAVADQLDASKTDVVIALLNEGLTLAQEALGGDRPGVRANKEKKGG